MKISKIKIGEGEKLVSSLEKVVAERNIKNAVIVSCVGALKEFELITIYQDSKKIPPEHFPTKFLRNAELLASGSVSDGKVHLHAVLGLEGGKALSGHLVEGIVTYFAEIFLLTENNDG